MRTFLKDTHAELGGAVAMMGVVISTLIAIVIGVLVWYKVNLSMYTASIPAAPVAANTAAYNASYRAQVNIWNATNASANTVWTLFPIVCIVLIAGVVLFIVMGFGRSQA